MNYYAKIAERCISGEDAINVCKTFCKLNDDDDTTLDVIMAIFAELFDCSTDIINEIIHD